MTYNFATHPGVLEWEIDWVQFISAGLAYPAIKLGWRDGFGA